MNGASSCAGVIGINERLVPGARLKHVPTGSKQDGRTTFY